MVKSRFEHLKLAGLSVVVPDNPRSIDEDLDLFDSDPDKLARAKKTLGLGLRYRCPEGITPTDLGREAARRLLDDMAVEPGEIDALIAVVTKPDYPYPGAAFVLHGALGLPSSCVALDLNHGCPGFIYGLWTAGGLLESGAARKILLVAADYHQSPHPLRSRILFGDAGAAALLTSDDAAGPSWFNLQSDGRGLSTIIRPGGGARLPMDRDLLELEVKTPAGDPVGLLDEFLDGFGVFDFATREAPPNVKALLEYAQVPLEEIDFAAFHQANRQIVDRVAAKIGLKPEQYSTRTFSEFGNQSTASVPGVLAHLLSEHISSGRRRVLLSAFGVGAGWASAVMDLDRVRCAGVLKLKLTPQRSRAEEIAHWEKVLAQGKA